MKRLLFDISRWSLFLHREARDLDPAHDADDPVRQFEDELFERLYAGDAESLPETDRDQRLAPWAEKIHAACNELPSFERLAATCRGDAGRAATAVETIMSELGDKLTELTRGEQAPELRRLLRRLCDKATSALDELDGAREGLEHVRFGPIPGSGSSRGHPTAPRGERALVSRLKNDHRLRRIALLAGRFKRIAARKQRTKVRHGADEITDVEQGGDLARLLPAELGKLRHPRLRLALLRDLLERQCLQYALRGSETLGRGPLVVCLDKSGSMDGPPDIWATAVALALLEVAQRERRPFALLGFDGEVKYEAFVEVGQSLPEDGLFVSCGGGTDIHTVITRGLEIIATHPGRLRKADLVLITDGGSSADDAPALRATAVSLGATILGFGIGVEPASLSAWCDEAHAIADLNNLDERAAEALFTHE